MRWSAVILLAPSALGAQTRLGDRIVAARTATVSFSAHTRDNVCGDGVSSFSDGLSGPRTRVYDGMLLTHGPWDNRIPPCERGPMRVTMRVVERTPSSLRTVVAPVATPADSVTDLGLVSTADAGAYLTWLARHGDGRVSESAMLPLVLLDIARTNAHPDVRPAALYQLGQLADPRGVAYFLELLRSSQ